MKVLLLSLLVAKNIVLFGMEITENIYSHTRYSIPPLKQLCAEACVQHKLHYAAANIPQECKNFIATHGYYKEPLTKDNLAIILPEAKKRGHQKKIEECRNFYKQETLTIIASPEFQNYRTFQPTEVLELPYYAWQNLQQSAFDRAIKTMAINKDPEELPLLMKNSDIEQQKNNYLEKRECQRKLALCCYTSFSILCPTFTVVCIFVATQAFFK